MSPAVPATTSSASWRDAPRALGRHVRLEPGRRQRHRRGAGRPDTLVFNGSDVAETFDVSANGRRVRFTRDVGNITMDLDGVEEIDLNALGGADTVTVNDLYHGPT